jgi:hypothetical protein
LDVVGEDYDEISHNEHAQSLEDDQPSEEELEQEAS